MLDIRFSHNFAKEYPECHRCLTEKKSSSEECRKLPSSRLSLGENGSFRLHNWRYTELYAELLPEPIASAMSRRLPEVEQKWNRLSMGANGSYVAWYGGWDSYQQVWDLKGGYPGLELELQNMYSCNKRRGSAPHSAKIWVSQVTPSNHRLLMHHLR